LNRQVSKDVRENCAVRREKRKNKKHQEQGLRVLKEPALFMKQAWPRSVYILEQQIHACQFTR